MVTDLESSGGNAAGWMTCQRPHENASGFDPEALEIKKRSASGGADAVEETRDFGFKLKTVAA